MTSEGRERPAAADLLQMWVGGTSTPAQDDVEKTTTTDAAPADAAPESEAGSDLWPSDEESADGQGAEEWWPYDEQAAAQPDAVAPSGSSALPEPEPEPAPEPAAEALWDDSVETEWDEPAADAPDTADTEAESPAEPAATVEGPHERGWASFGAAQTAEDVLDQLGREDGWAQTPPVPTQADPAADEPAPVDEAPVVEPTPLRPRPGLDLSATTHWSLDDFESYIRAQGSNELAGWMSGSTTPTVEPEPETEPEPEPEPVTAAAPEPEPEPEPEPVVEEPEPEPALEPAAEQTVAWAAPEAPAEAPQDSAEADVEPDVQPEEAAPRKRGLLAKMGLARDQETEEQVAESESPEQPADAEQWAEPDVEWDPYASDAAVESPASAGQQPLFEVPEPEPTAASPAVPESAAESAAESSDWDPEATQYFDWTLDEADPEDVPLPSGGPVGAKSVVPGLATQEPDPEPAAVEQPVDDQDYQEWYDDQGLRWVSTDGGYTWYSEDGQGWNAEVGEPIEVPADAVIPSAAPAPAAPAAIATAATPEVPPETSDETAVVPVSDDSWPARPDAQPDDEVWPAAADDTPTTTAEGWPEPEQSGAPADSFEGLYAAPATSTPSPEVPASSAPSGSSALSTSSGSTAMGPPAGAPEIPPFVEYKPRGAYRPILGVLFVAAAILAVVAIFWAVSKGSQAATGIAAGVTGFALAFWWGLLSWTPTVVSLSGSVLEVARGSDGERFDLRSPKLVIDVDEDVDSRNWRTTITRPNGTELVIPASAVDPEEFSRIVRHYRAEAVTS